MKPILPLSLLAAAALLAGCPQNGTVDPSAIPVSNGPVRRISLWPSSSTALNWDADPEPDGLYVPVFLWGDGPLPVHRLGTFEAVLTRQDPADSAQRIELYRWTFGPEQTRDLVRLNRRGWPFYPLVLDWGDKVPTVGTVLLQIRFIDPASGPVTSEEVLFTVTRTAPRAG
jgi:hypothetical protein